MATIRPIAISGTDAPATPNAGAGTWLVWGTIVLLAGGIFIATVAFTPKKRKRAA